jgi:hypothetical protein
VGFLVWLEATSLADWVRGSFIGYPMMITLHAFGMAIMVGLAIALDLRLLGWFKGIPYTAVQRFFGVAWIGFGINFLSGSALFTTQSASKYIVLPGGDAFNWIFIGKMTLVFAGAGTVAMLQSAIGRDGATWSPTNAPTNVKVTAALSIVFWVVAITLGRLTAYLGG